MATVASDAPPRFDSCAEDLAARSAIATNLARHSRGIDRNDLALLCSAYHPDAEVAYGMFEGPARDFAGFLTEAMASGPVTQHRISNIFITVDGDRARSETYVFAYTRTPEGDGSVQRLIGGRYLDRHEKRDGEWRIAHRTYVMDWNANAPNREMATPGSSGLHGAQRDVDAAQALFTSFRETEAKGTTSMATGPIEEAIAKQALHDLVVTYARGVDRGDEALLASVFHPDSQVITGVVDASGPDYARDIVAWVRGNVRSCAHTVSNEYYEVAGDRAVGEVYVLAHMVSAGDDPQETFTGGRYLDRFEKRDGAWRIAERSFIYDWSMTRPLTREETGMYEQLPTRGGFTPDDPSVAFWNA
ncbi:MAG TPA: nuclear transport factor 2 family protein [Sphingomonas sp.]|nr:nuclear transport factor 2 family protein [Sphingomonas sp.]